MNYWSNRGFLQDNPKFLIGNLGAFLLKGNLFTQYFKEAYFQYKKFKVIGLYFSYQKILLVNDPKVIQDIMISDFNHFHDRPSFVNEEKNPLSAHLFALTGQRWRDLRVKLTPAFTSGKLKAMFPTIRECSKVLQDYLVKNVGDGVNEFEFRDLFARYSTSVISSVAFGVDNDCINEPDNIFRQTGKKIFPSSTSRQILRFLFLFTPKLLAKLNLKLSNPEVEKFFFELVRQTVEYREKINNFERKDFMQMLIQLKNQGYLSVDKNDEQHNREKDMKTKKLTFNEVVSQAFLFFVAGFDGLSSTMNFCLVELCKNPKIQTKVQNELDKFVNDELTYENLSDHKYLECCIDETLRKHSAVNFLTRVCTKDYRFTDTDMIVEKGTQVIIPVSGLHHDPEIYESPREFKPERFLNSTNGTDTDIKGLFYLPFGDGPRKKFFFIISYLNLKKLILNFILR